MSENSIRDAFVCSRGTLDGAYPSLVLAINSARLGHQAQIFYTFMGINAIRKGGAHKLKFYMPGFLGAIPGMACLATFMMKRQIEGAGIATVPELMETAQLEGVKLIACHMTMGMMKLTKADLMEGVEVMTAEEYLKLAGSCSVNMFT